MQTDENTGKKQLTTRMVREAFEIVHSRTEENPVQILVRAVENAAPREETVRLKYGGISVPKAVDISPQRRVDQALKFIAEGVYNASFKTETDAAEALASQLMGAANNDVNAYPVDQKEEKERVAAAAR
jgi:small subunit ribosomal protein S7